MGLFGEVTRKFLIPFYTSTDWWAPALLGKKCLIGLLTRLANLLTWNFA